MREYPDVALAGLDPKDHHRDYGRSESRYPNSIRKWIDHRNWPGLLVYTGSYLAAYTDVADVKMSARMHDARWGRYQGRYPSAVNLLFHVAARTLTRMADSLRQIRAKSADLRDFSPADLFLLARFGSRSGSFLRASFRSSCFLVCRVSTS